MSQPYRRSEPGPAASSARASRRPSPLLGLAGLLLAALALSACGGSDQSGSGSGAPSTERFDVDRAMALVDRQVAVGQRPAGSPRLRGLAAELRPMLPGGTFEAF